ncbi:tail spike protein [Acinetobacter phage vB_AbaP_Alexa]|nr:tail spike protein [Acinetobacter phage vB_AbaP_Alexa]
MANLTPVDEWSSVPQLERTTPALGGPGAVMNAQAQALLNRTENLRKTRVVSVETFADLVGVTGAAKAIVSRYSADVPELSGGGAVRFIAGEVNYNNVDTFPGTGGVWKRENWKNPSIYDAGIIGNETAEVTDRFQQLVNLASGTISLKKKIVKLNKLDMPSNVRIYNGTIDFSGSNEVQQSNSIHNGYIVGANRSRLTDPEAESVYNSIETLNGAGMVKINFKIPRRNFSANIACFHKVDDLTMSRCTVDQLGAANLLKVVGGMNGTNPTSTGTWDTLEPKNGWCNGIRFTHNKVTGGLLDTAPTGKYIIGTLSRFVACRDVEAKHNATKDVAINALLDAYCYNSEAKKNRYSLSAAVVQAIKDGNIVPTDFVCVYVGQCAYDIDVKGNQSTDAVFSGIYVEGAKNVRVNGNNLKLSSLGLSVTTQPRLGINLQSNHIAVSGTNYDNIAGVDEIVVSGNCVKNYEAPFATSGILSQSHRNISVFGNFFYAGNNTSAAVLSNILESKFSDNICKGNLFLGECTDNTITDNIFQNTSNYALYLSSDRKTRNRLIGNVFRVDSGYTIYNGGNDSDSLYIQGGVISSGMQLGASSLNLTADGFSNELVAKTFTFNQRITLAAGATTTFSKSVTGLRRGWGSKVELFSLVDNFTLYGIDLTIKSEVLNDSLTVYVKNVGTAAIDFTPTFLVTLSPFMSKEFLN